MSGRQILDDRQTAVSAAVVDKVDLVIAEEFGGNPGDLVIELRKVLRFIEHRYDKRYPAH